MRRASNGGIIMVLRPFVAASSLLALISASPAFAQGKTQPTAQDTNAGGKPVAQDQSQAAIIVTAQLREQRQIDVPFALSAYTGRQLEQLGVQEFEDLARFTPGLQVQNQSPNNPAINIRGITSDSGDAFFEPRISIYQDGVSISKPAGAYVELFDIERVEVSKGPQSTLYGRGALIGAINIVQAKPDLDSTFGMVRGAYGNYNYWLGEAMLNAPVSPTLGVRISGRYKHRDGYVENLLGGNDFQSVETGAIRGAIRFKPSNRVTADLIAN